MKKTTRNILIMLAVLVVLGGAVAVLLLTQPETEEVSSEVSSTPAVAVMNREPSDVASISVKNTEGSYEFVPQEQDTVTSVASGESSSVSAAEVDFLLKGYENYDVNTSKVTSSAKSVLSINATKELGEQDSLESFGLSGDSAVTVDITYQDGSKDQLILGGKAGESAGKYLLKDGKVYIVSGLSDQLYGSAFAFFNTELYTVADRMEEVVDSEGSSSEQTAVDLLYSMKLTGTNFEKPIELKYDATKTSGYLITSPVTAESGSTKFSEMVEALKILAADSVVAAGLSSETLEQYGLKEPFAQIEFDMNGEKHTLKVSAADEDGNRYLTADDKDLVYQIASDKVATWAETKLMDLRMSYIWLPNIMDVSKLTMTVEGDMVYSYDVTRTKNEEKSTEDNISYDLTLQNAGGQAVEYTNYQSFYKQLISIAVLTPDEVEYGEEPVFRVEYEYFSGNEGDAVEFYPVEGQDRYAAVLNGQFNGLVRKSEVEKVIALIPDLDANKAQE